MAIYHLSAKPVQRSAGKSAVAAAAYRSRSTLCDERQAMTFSYTAKQDLVHVEIVGFDGPRSTLWNLAESMEKRKDATTAREYEIALPRELSEPDQIELARDFATWLNQQQGCVVDFAIHSGDGDNPHIHMLTTTRSVDAYGTMADIKIPREWSDKKRKAHGLPGRKVELETVRERWSLMANAALNRAGIEERIDHRSYADQGIDRLPASHLGPAASTMERDGLQTRAGDHNRMIMGINLERQFELDDLRKHEANVDALAKQLADIDVEIEVIRKDPASTTAGLIEQGGHSATIAAVADRASARYDRGMAKSFGEQFKSKLFQKTWNAKIDPRILKTLKWVDVESRALTLKSGEQIQDQGDRVSLSKGSDDGIAAAIAMARSKGWTSVRVNGSDDFQIRAALALQESGIKPELTSEIAKERFSEKIRVQSKSVARKPERSPGPTSDPKPEIDIDALKDQISTAFAASPLAQISFQKDDPKRLEKWVRARWDELTTTDEPEGLADAFRSIAEEHAYLAGYSVRSVQEVGIDDKLSKRMLGYRPPKPALAPTPDSPASPQGQHRTWYPDSGQKSPGP